MYYISDRLIKSFLTTKLNMSLCDFDQYIVSMRFIIVPKISIQFGGCCFKMLKLDK